MTDSKEIIQALGGAIDNYPAHLRARMALAEKIQAHPAVAIMDMFYLEAVGLVKMILPDIVGLIVIDRQGREEMLGLYPDSCFVYEEKTNSLKLNFYFDRGHGVSDYHVLYIRKNLDLELECVWNGYQPRHLKNQLVVRKILSKYIKK